jgi:hypothetical protein
MESSLRLTSLIELWTASISPQSELKHGLA